MNGLEKLRDSNMNHLENLRSDLVINLDNVTVYKNEDLFIHDFIKKSNLFIMLVNNEENDKKKVIHDAACETLKNYIEKPRNNSFGKIFKLSQKIYYEFDKLIQFFFYLDKGHIEFLIKLLMDKLNKEILFDEKDLKINNVED